MREYFIDVMFSNELIAEITKDGLLYKFKAEDISKELDKHYMRGHRCWYFNKTKDRMCAEYSRHSYSHIIVNPSAVVICLGYPVIFAN